jgi:DNA (cytosine-5)-methyltransferase 1
LSLFSGAGGLDLGFEMAGFRHLEAIDIDKWSIKTLKRNRPEWNPVEADIREYTPHFTCEIDVITAGFPCQGFSLGGKRDSRDERNTLYREIIRIAELTRPKIIIMENVLNLRTMISPDNGRPFAEQIAMEFRSIGYDVVSNIFKMCDYGVPQTRRRFVFVAFRGESVMNYRFPTPKSRVAIREFLVDLLTNNDLRIANHEPEWGFGSKVHVETGETYLESELPVPIRISRTASDGCPVRSLDEPFPAVDTATVWGWAQGNVTASRVQKDRRSGKFIRNPEAIVPLWRVNASRIRRFTPREYARLQTFPDEWIFEGTSQRDFQLQIGNAVPVQFAIQIAKSIMPYLRMPVGTPRKIDHQMTLGI